MTLSRRALIASLGAIGLVAAVPEPVKRYWQLDRSMVEPKPTDPGGMVWWATERYDAGEVHFSKADARFRVTYVDGTVHDVPAIHHGATFSMPRGLAPWRSANLHVVHVLDDTVIWSPIITFDDEPLVWAEVSFGTVEFARKPIIL